MYKLLTKCNFTTCTACSEARVNEPDLRTKTNKTQCPQHKTVKRKGEQPGAQD